MTVENETQPAAKLVQKATATHQKIARSADKLVESADVQVDSADRRTELAGDRTTLAAERTYAAWVRTGLAALGTALALRSLLESAIGSRLALVSAIVLVVLAEFCFVAGVWRELGGQVPHTRADWHRIPVPVLIAVNAVLGLLGLIVLVGIVSR